MTLLPEIIETYIEQHSTAESHTLAALNRETHLKVLMPRMLSGQVQGMFLQLLSHAIQPQNILEIGTYTGYSAICLAQGLQANGRLHTIDINEELYDLQQKYFEQAGLGQQIIPYIGNALDIIPTLDETFDLVFIDADKQSYSAYYQLVFPKVRIGGYILADNVLWSGKIVDPTPDKDTLALQHFNDFVQKDVRTENILLPLRDGIMIARKIAE